MTPQFKEAEDRLLALPMGKHYFAAYKMLKMIDKQMIVGYLLFNPKAPEAELILESYCRLMNTAYDAWHQYDGQYSKLRAYIEKNFQPLIEVREPE